MTGTSARIPLLLDVDTGIDDSLALLYACASTEAEIVAVTCVAGNVDARQVAEKAEPGSVILAMLPDTGERYLSTPLFGDVGAEPERA